MPNAAKPHMSKAADGGHARKLYSLFAKDHNAYVLLNAPHPAPPAIGQVIAKESWVPELVKDAKPDDPRGGWAVKPEKGAPDVGDGDHFGRYHREGDKLYRAATLAGVYLVYKKPETTPGTDKGWVYATLTPKGEVTSAGRVASCMGCHASAKHERLFGSRATE
jgi:hypothetical protein